MVILVFHHNSNQSPTKGGATNEYDMQYVSFMGRGTDDLN